MMQRIKLPIKFTAFSFTVVIFIMIALGYQVLTAYQNLESIQTRSFRLQHLAHQMTYLDEVLTMSARMAAETSDLYWERRYLNHVKLLDKVLLETSQLSGEIYQKWATQTVLANEKLVQIENEVFKLVAEGKAMDALVLLNNEDYEIYKQDFADGMSGLRNELEIKNLSDIRKHERSVYIAGILIFISIPFLVFVWLRIVSLLRQYQQANEESQQKLSEEYEYSRMLFETSPIGLALTDMQGNLIDSNPAYHSIIGYTRDEVEKLSYWDLTPKDYEEQEIKQLEALETTGRYGPYEKEYHHKNGTRIPVLLNGLIIKKNNIPYIWSTIEDISIRKEAEKSLIESKNRAELANKEKSRFLANMSHELRTPMHAILSFTKLASKRVEDEKTSRFLNNIELSSQRLTGLLNALLDLSKIEAGKIDVTYQKENLYLVTQQSISQISSLIEEKNLRIELDSDEHIEAYFDANLISQVIINLLSNAIKYSPSDDVINIKLISVEAVPDTNFNGIVECVISDNGIGIPTDELESVFEKFTQSSKTDTKAGGTGLGLSICREIINMHYGAIWIESPVQGCENGTSAHFIIPKIHSENITDNTHKNNTSLSGH